jgi:FAD/FMN-containing dehydrogenase
VTRSSDRILSQVAPNAPMMMRSRRASPVCRSAAAMAGSASENEDLFWALRGGGGNFGIATSFAYRMHPLGPAVMAGAVYYPFDQTCAVLARFRDFAKAAPDPLTVYPCLICLEDGRPILCMAACYAGPVEEGEQAVAALRYMGEPLSDQLKPMPFVEWQRSMDAARPAGRCCAMRSHFLADLDEGFVDALAEQFAASPSRLLGCHSRALPWSDCAGLSGRDGLCLAHQSLSFRDHRPLGRADRDGSQYRLV